MLLPLASHGQTPARLRKIGILGSSDDPAQAQFIVAMRGLGWEEGRTATYLYRSADQRNERYPELARELVANGVDLIMVTAGVTAALAAKQATTTIPILAVGVADPVKFGLVASLARPGGNVTGVTAPVPDWGKYVEIAREAVARSTRIAVIANPTSVVYRDYVEQNEAAARQLGVRLQMIPVAKVGDIASAFEAMKRERSEAMIFGPDRLYFANVGDILDAARDARMPAIAPFVFAAEKGALVAYGLDSRDMVREAAAYADRLLRGAAPADLPVAQPTRFKLVVNLKTAKTLGLTIPQSMLLRADEVIQ
jgi:putative tryptophan/tyrosine transport system substrate-binding protein